MFALSNTCNLKSVICKGPRRSMYPVPPSELLYILQHIISTVMVLFHKKESIAFYNRCRLVNSWQS